jgi:chromosome segregation ATPase
VLDRQHRERNRDLDECNDSAEREREVLLSQLEEKQTEIDKLRRTQPSPADKLEAKEHEVLVDILKTELREVKREVEKRRMELETVRREKSVLAAELEQSKTVAADAITQVQRGRAALTHNDSDVTELRTALELSRQATVDVVEELERDRGVYKSEIGELSVRCGELRTQLEAVQEQYGSVAKERDSLSVEAGRLEGRLQESEQSRTALEDKTAGLVTPAPPPPACCEAESQTEIVNQDPDSMDWYVELQKERSKTKALTIQVEQLTQGKEASERAVRVLEERVLLDAFLVDEALSHPGSKLTEEQAMRLRSEAW